MPHCNTPVLRAAPHWQSVDFISDLHLQPSQATTFDAWSSYMAACPADALFILGDLFEVWAGDDIAQSKGTDAVFVRQCQAVLRQATQRLTVYFMHGNRDFLLGNTFANASGMTLLQDPTLFDFDGQCCLLSHGDALCLDDVDYQKFRLQVRSTAWQQSFLAKPLPERLAIAHALRAQSESRKATCTSYADVDASMATQWLQQTHATTLIHGHTHRPSDHVLNSAQTPLLKRIVLSDWDAGATPPRLEVLRLTNGNGPHRISTEQASLPSKRHRQEIRAH